MLKAMKTSDIVTLYQIIKSSHLNKCEDADKFLMIKNISKMKPVVTSFEDFRNEAQEKLKDDRFDDMQKMARKWQDEGEKTTLSDKEKIEVNTYFVEYSDKVNACIQEEADKDIDIEIKKLSEKGFQSFISSNDFTLEQCAILNETLMAES